MPNRKKFIQQIGLMAGAFSSNSLFNELHAAEIFTANQKVKHLSPACNLLNKLLEEKAPAINPIC